MYLTLFILFVFGLATGSFLNVVIFRMRLGKNFLGRSACLACGKILKWVDNIPVLSFINLKGRCRYCQSRISWQYPLIELSLGIIFIFGYFRFGINLELMAFVIFAAFLSVIFVYDLKHYLILDKVTVPAMVLALVLNPLFGKSPVDLILGASILAGFFLLQYFISGGRWIGGGDIRMGAVMGFMLGWKLGLLALFMAYMFGAVAGVVLLALKKKKIGSEIPFGTFLSLATLICLLYGQEILNWYLNLIIF